MPHNVRKLAGPAQVRQHRAQARLHQRQHAVGLVHEHRQRARRPAQRHRHPDERGSASDGAALALRERVDQQDRGSELQGHRQRGRDRVRRAGPRGPHRSSSGLGPTMATYSDTGRLLRARRRGAARHRARCAPTSRRSSASPSAARCTRRSPVESWRQFQAHVRRLHRSGLSRLRGPGVLRERRPPLLGRPGRVEAAASAAPRACASRCRRERRCGASRHLEPGRLGQRPRPSSMRETQAEKRRCDRAATATRRWRGRRESPGSSARRPSYGSLRTGVGTVLRADRLRAVDAATRAPDLAAPGAELPPARATRRSPGSTRSAVARIESIDYTLMSASAGRPLRVYDDLAPAPEHPATAQDRAASPAVRADRVEPAPARGGPRHRAGAGRVGERSRAGALAEPVARRVVAPHRAPIRSGSPRSRPAAC